jgi:hypothetical protein
MPFELAAASCVLAGVLAEGYRRDRRRHRQWQQSMLDCADSPLANCARHIEPDGYPMLTGRFGGFPAEVRLIRDDVTVRKVPCLWLSVSLHAPLPGCPTIDVLARMRGTEFYSPLLRLPHRLEPLPPWPSELTVKCSSPAAPLAELSRWICEHFADPAAKEFLVTPRGVRLVQQVAQARRAEYLVLRAGHFDAEPVAATTLHTLFARMLAVAQALSDHADRTRADQAAA